MTLVRNKRNENGISPKLAAKISISAKNETSYKLFDGIIKKIANVNSIVFGKNDDGLKGLVGKDEVSIEYIGWEMKQVDSSELLKEIDYLTGFLKSVDAKLTNEKFMANAKPDLIEKEKQKKMDAESKLSTLKKQITV